jgi:hypothetical protein
MNMRTSRKITAAAAALASLGIASPALAAGPSGNGTVTGTITVPTTLTLTLSATTFAFTATPGQMNYADTGGSTPTAGAVTATVSTNDGGGYSLSDNLDPAYKSGFTGAHSSDSIDGSLITAYADMAGVWASPYGDSGTVATLAEETHPSGPSGDTWPLSWEFNIPANQPGDTYTGEFDVLATGS